MSFALRKFEWVPTLMASAGFLLMATLGAWQLQRLEWKEGLIAQVTTAYQQSPLTALPKTPEELKSAEFFPVALKGKFDSDTEFHIAARYYRSKLGYHILAPFILSDGRVVLVNRGWVPADKKESATRRETNPEKIREVHGIIHSGGKKSWALPDNQPEKNLWFWYATDAMGKTTGKDYLNVVIDATGQEDLNQLPIPAGAIPKLRNDHLGYAITWFGIAIAIAVIWAVYHRKP